VKSIVVHELRDAGRDRRIGKHGGTCGREYRHTENHSEWRSNVSSFPPAITVTDSAFVCRVKLSAVVLNYRTPAQTIHAVGSLLQSARAIGDLIIVNNDHDSRFERDPSWPDVVRVIETGANLGYSGGMNAGIRSALNHGAACVLLLNSDAIVSPACVGALEQALSSTPRAGIAGPVIVSRANPARVESAGMAYSERTGRMRLTAHDALLESLQLPRRRSSMASRAAACSSHAAPSSKLVC
jgi:hypothetical protein